MEHKDYATDERGCIMSVTGENALLSDVLFCLTARRGSFPLLPEFGSRMYLLRNAKPSLRTVLARQYAAEALADRDDLTVTDACVTVSGESLTVRIELTRQGEGLSVELEG